MIKSKKDIKIKNYLEYENYIINNSGVTEDIMLATTVKMLCGLSNEEFDKLSYQKVIDLYKILEKILSEKQNLVTKFKIKGKTYAINPDFSKLTFKELVDLKTDSVVEQINILYRPIKHKIFNKYSIQPYNADIDNVEAIKELGIDIYFGFVGFFLKIHQDYTNFILKSIKDQDLVQ